MLSFFGEWFSSFKQSSEDRVKSPVFGTFIFCWLSFNISSVLVLLLSKKPIEATLLSLSSKMDISDYLIGPLLTTALLLFMLPQIHLLVLKHQSGPLERAKAQQALSKEKNASSEFKIAQHEAKRKLAYRQEEQNIEHNINNVKKEIETLSAENERIRRDLDAAKELNSKVQLAVDNLNKHNETLQENFKDAAASSSSAQQVIHDLQKEIVLLKNESDKLTNNARYGASNHESMVEKNNAIIKAYPNLFQSDENGWNIVIKPEAHSYLQSYLPRS
ncbi:hypothetical protein SerAS12_2716 [Serratia sp. AS12]|uniref:hypothetical protein n=1 Tax=Serratia TaxID=613 RepID=UPI00020EA0C4|nr:MULTISPECIES: hypothetical protein [Serratia]AEF45836.1 hypothetical protein SerAS9_2715 [Serratia plymuthica AS9]AEF50787.1 hypothetical protein SerAS12_2716 [Serratia sp. AS12]AEG28494.1 hypothetical protein SerAS13_2717 [Serratia sp. AS13]UTN94594.1 hypothetical protein NLX81_13840 [Serratia plymuthica]